MYQKLRVEPITLHALRRFGYELATESALGVERSLYQ